MQAKPAKKLAYRWNPKPLRDARMRQNMSRVELARLCGVTWQAVWKWENGHSAPSSNRLPVLRRVLGLDTDRCFEIR